MAFSEHQSANYPLQLYDAAKKGQRDDGAQLWRFFCLPTTGLRFFAVYGPWGGPDMALIEVTKNPLGYRLIPVFNLGSHMHDLTCLTDLVEGVIRSSDQDAQLNPVWDINHLDPATSNVPFRTFNTGKDNPVKLSAYIEAIEAALGKGAIKDLLPLHAGDVPDTFADSSELEKATGYKPVTSVTEGVTAFVQWYRQCFQA